MSKTLVIVEDNKLNLRLLNDVLQAKGYHTLVCGDGRGVIDLIKQHAADGLILDIQLPGMAGLDIAREIRQTPEIKGLPIIAVTGLAMKGDEQRILRGGCDAYLAKPISLSKFLETVALLCDT